MKFYAQPCGKFAAGLRIFHEGRQTFAVSSLRMMYRKFALERLLQEDAVLFCAVLLSRIQNMYIKISVKSLKTWMCGGRFDESYARIYQINFFYEIDMQSIGGAIAYIVKYLEKTGEKIVYSKGLPQYFVSDVMDEDVVCPFGLEDKKLLLYDDFLCWDEGVLVGAVSKAVINQMPKAN